MQRLSVFALCCVLAFGLAGCSSDKGADTAATTPPASTTPTTPPASATPPAGDTASKTPPAGAAEQKSESPDTRGKEPAGKVALAKPEAGASAGKEPAKGEAAAPAQGAEKGGKLVKTASGLQYEDIVVGKGESPKPGQQVTVDYTGTLADGKKFDSSIDHGQPFTFIIGQHQVIAGWDEGVMSMKIGGKRKLVIPPDLAYGDNPPPGIPPGATLTFIVELHGVQ